MDSTQEFTRRMVRTVMTVTLVAIVVAALWAARAALMLIYVSALIAMGFSPLVRIIEQPRRAPGGLRVPRALAIFSIYLTVVGALVLLGLMIIPTLVDQATTLWERMPEWFNDFQQFLIRHNLTTRRVTLQEAVQNAPAGSGGNAVGTVLVALWSVGGSVFGLITILILSFYLLIEAESLFNYVAAFIPEPQRGHLTTAAHHAVTKVSAWLRAQFVLAGVMGACAAIGLGLLGVPYFYVVALIAAVGETIPMVGPIVAGITAVGIALSVSTKLAVTVGLFFFVLHQIEANVLVPKIMERRVGVSPVTVIVALLIGGALLGLTGAILAVPTAAILSVVVEEFRADAAPH